MTTKVWSPNKKIGSIEYVGQDGFIVEASDPCDPDFIGGKRLFTNFDNLLKFLATHLQVYKGRGAAYGINPPQDTNVDLEVTKTEEKLGGNGTSIHASISQIGGL